MKKRLIILSDLWGREKSEWLINYTRILKSEFDIEYYDSCELGEVDKTEYTERTLHKQFVNGGVERAVEKLLDQEKDTVNVLAFSIGGTIAWKFGVISSKIDSLFCVSSTRLRNEIIKPKGKITLYFGENDEYKPPMEWFDQMKLNPEILKGKSHQIYSEPDFAKGFCKQIIESTKNMSTGRKCAVELKARII